MSWNYQVVRRKCSEGWEPFKYIYGIHEAYYDDEGRCYAITAEPVEVVSESPNGINAVLAMMKLDARKRPVLDYETREPLAADADTR
jgi:hypothetical protein